MLFHIRERHRLDVYCENRTNKGLVQSLAIAFPIHFVAFEELVIRQDLNENKKELKK